MKIRIFNIPTQDPDAGITELNSLLASQRIIHIERHQEMGFTTTSATIQPKLSKAKYNVNAS